MFDLEKNFRQVNPKATFVSLEVMNIANDITSKGYENEFPSSFQKENFNYISQICICMTWKAI